MTLATEPNLEELAVHYAADLLHRALLEAGEPIKASDAARMVGRDDFDMRLARVVLSIHPQRFTVSERRWTLWTRFADPERPFERNLEEILEVCGLPLRVRVLAREAAAIYGRPAEVYEQMLPRLLSNGERYFRAGEDVYGLTRWLLDTSSETPEDVLFDNYLKASEVAAYEQAAGALAGIDSDSVIAFLDAVAALVPNKILQFLAWKTAPRRFQPADFYRQLLEDGRAVYLSSGQWLGPELAARIAAHFPAIAEREVEEYVELQPAAVSQPLVVTETEREQIVAAVMENEGTSRAQQILEEIFEVTPGEPNFEGDLQTLIETLRSDERVLWLGSDRFVPQGTLPPYVYTVPESLHYPDVRYTDSEGNELDVMLEDEGFDGGLEREIRLPVAQDVLDEEPVVEEAAEPPATVRCVLKLHHKEIGTFPLCQLPPRFFPTEPTILQVDLLLPNSQRVEIWVNNETRLVYGLLDWYLTLPVDSGAVFYLERQAPDRYALTYGEETEPTMFISRNRVNELLELGQRAEAEELPTFDIVREIMEHYRKGIEYITLLTEVNIARRTRRRLIASLLSGYHCFFQRGGSWVYDARKLSQGFDKSKRKYLKK